MQTYKNLQDQAHVRQSRIYLETYFDARKNNVDKFQAAGRANNALTRAGIARIDRVSVNKISKRDKEIREMEEKLEKR